MRNVVKFALNKAGQRIMASPGGKGFCQWCNSPVTAHCGPKLAWHWSHDSKEDCPYHKYVRNETPWHKIWKSYFPLTWHEFVSFDPETREKHIADVKTPLDFVLEFQNSPITPEEIASREKHHKTMAWIANEGSTDPLEELIKESPYFYTSEEKIAFVQRGIERACEAVRKKYKNAKEKALKTQRGITHKIEDARKKIADLERQLDEKQKFYQGLMAILQQEVIPEGNKEYLAVPAAYQSHLDAKPYEKGVFGKFLLMFDFPSKTRQQVTEKSEVVTAAAACQAEIESLKAEIGRQQALKAQGEQKLEELKSTLQQEILTPEATELAAIQDRVNQIPENLCWLKQKYNQARWQTATKPVYLDYGGTYLYWINYPQKHFCDRDGKTAIAILREDFIRQYKAHESGEATGNA